MLEGQCAPISLVRAELCLMSCHSPQEPTSFLCTMHLEFPWRESSVWAEEGKWFFYFTKAQVAAVLLLSFSESWARTLGLVKVMDQHRLRIVWKHLPPSSEVSPGVEEEEEGLRWGHKVHSSKKCVPQWKAVPGCC